MKEYIKFKDSLECKLYVTGCLHLGHLLEGVWKSRGYNSPLEHTNGLIRTINETCREQDVLLVLGDFCLNTSEEQFYQYLKDIKPKLWFLKGNHNNPWIKLYFKHSKEKFGYEVRCYEWLNKITYWGDYLHLSWNKQITICNHYPYYVFDMIKVGGWSLVSHSHGSCQLTRPENLTMKQLDCGWDIHKKPLTFEEIQLIMLRKGIPAHDHHSDMNLLLITRDINVGD